MGVVVVLDVDVAQVISRAAPRCHSASDMSWMAMWFAFADAVALKSTEHATANPTWSLTWLPKLDTPPGPAGEPVVPHVVAAPAGVARARAGIRPAVANAAAMNKVPTLRCMGPPETDVAVSRRVVTW